MIQSERAELLHQQQSATLPAEEYDSHKRFCTKCRTTCLAWPIVCANEQVKLEAGFPNPSLLQITLLGTQDVDYERFTGSHSAYSTGRDGIFTEQRKTLRELCHALEELPGVSDASMIKPYAGCCKAEFMLTVMKNYDSPWKDVLPNILYVLWQHQGITAFTGMTQQQRFDWAFKFDEQLLERCADEALHSSSTDGSKLLYSDSTIMLREEPSECLVLSTLDKRWSTLDLGDDLLPGHDLENNADHVAKCVDHFNCTEWRILECFLVADPRIKLGMPRFQNQQLLFWKEPIPSLEAKNEPWPTDLLNKIVAAYRKTHYIIMKRAVKSVSIPSHHHPVAPSFSSSGSAAGSDQPRMISLVDARHPSGSEQPIHYLRFNPNIDAAATPGTSFNMDYGNDTQVPERLISSTSILEELD